MQTHYQTLGIEANATPTEIKNAYRKRALKTHPDKLPADLDADTRAQKVNEFKQLEFAHSVLSDAQKRADYDEFLKNHAAFQRTASDHNKPTDVIDELYMAVLRGDANTIARLYKPEHENQHKSRYEYDLLTLAFKQIIVGTDAQCDVIAALLRAGADPNRVVYFGIANLKKNGMSLAVKYNRPDILQVFLDDPRTNLHLKDDDSGRTALEVAFEYLNLECINKLLDKIKPTATALDVMNVYTGLAKFYYESPQNSEVLSSGDNTLCKIPPIISVAMRHIDKQDLAIEIITRLLDLGANVNQTCSSGLTALDHLMTRRTYYNFWSDDTPSHPAEITKYFEVIVNLLIERGANVNHTYSCSYSSYPDNCNVFGSPLIDAVRFSDVNSVKIFLNERICTPPTLQILNHAITEIGVNRPNAQELQGLLTKYRTQHYLYVPKLFSQGYYVNREESEQYRFATWYETLPANHHELWQRVKQFFTSMVSGMKNIFHAISSFFFRESENNAENTTNVNHIEAPSHSEPKIDSTVKNPTGSTPGNQQQMLFSNAGRGISANNLNRVDSTTRQAPSITQRIRTACSIM